MPDLFLGRQGRVSAGGPRRRRPWRRVLRALALTLALSGALAACQEGAATDTPEQTQAPPPPPPPGPTTAPVSPDAVAARMSVTGLHKSGITGLGTLVALVDTGVQAELAEIAARISPLSRHMDPDIRDFADHQGHGTMMAHLIAGNGRDSGLVGMAPGASLLVLRTDRDTEPGVLSTQLIVSALYHAADRGAQIANLSLSAPKGAVSDAIGHVARQGMIVAIATGNNGADGKPSGIAREAGTYGPTVLAVTAVDADNVLAGFAAPCDVADPAYCVASPGVQVRVPGLDGVRRLVSGTSVATAIVSGGLALMQEYFPDLSPAEIVAILLDTTVDLGAAGVDRVYGSGLVDFAAAMRPVGTVTVAAEAGGAALDRARIALAGAFGDALARTEAFAAIPVRDGYGRRYVADLSAALTPWRGRLDHLDPLADLQSASAQVRLPGRTLSHRLMAEDTRIAGSGPTWRFDLEHRLGSGTRLTLTGETGQAALLPASDHFRLIDDDWTRGPLALSGDHRIGLFLVHPLSFGDLALSAETARGVADNMQVRLQGGLAVDLLPGLRGHGLLSALHEDRAILQSRFSGAFGEIAASRSVAATLGLGYRHGRLELFASASTGRTRSSMARQGLIAGMTGLRLSEWRAGAGLDHLFAAGDRLSLAVAQPLRIEGGRLRMFNGDSHDLEPSGRMTLAEMSYRLRRGRTDLGVSLLYARHPDHIARARDHLSAGLLVRHRF